MPAQRFFQQMKSLGDAPIRARQGAAPNRRRRSLMAVRRCVVSA
jgi:hypothetical protein